MGRSHEMAALLALLDRAEVGHADPLLVTAEAGMGKTALLDELVRTARCRDWRVARAAAPQGGEVSPFAVVEDLAHCLSDHVDHLAVDEARLLRAPPRDGTVGPAPVAAALLHLLEASSSGQPLLVLIDDLQWADPGSLAAICVAVGRLGQDRVAVVAAARPRPALDPRVHTWQRIEVGPLALDAARGLLRRSLADQGCANVPDERQAEHLAEALGRCPLALVEAGRLLSAEQLTGHAALPDPLPLAERLEEAWGRSWSALPEPTRIALLALAVTQGSGGALTARLLADLGLTVDALDPAGADGLLDPRVDSRGGRARLAHPLIRDAILAEAGLPAARTMHARAAGAAEVLGLPPSVVIAHLTAAAEPGDEAAQARLVAEAERAEAAGLGDSATHALLVAAELALTDLDRSRLAARAARAQVEHSFACTDITPILTLADVRVLAPEERFWIEWLRSEWLHEEDLSRALRAVETTAGWARRIDSPMMSWVQFSALTDAWGLLDGEAGLRGAQELREFADRPDADARGGMPAWACRGMYALALFQVGLVQAADAELHEVRELSRRWRPTGSAHLVQRLQVAAVDTQMCQLWPWVDVRFEELAELLAADPGQTLGYLRMVQAERALRRGQLGVARALIDEARALGFGSTSRAYFARWLEVSLRIAAVQGDAAVLAAQASALRMMAGRIGWVQIVSAADRAQGLAALGEGRLDDALTHLEPLADVPLLGRGPWDGVPMGRTDLVEALSRSGEAARAAEVAAGLAGMLAPAADTFARALVARLQGLVTQGDSAIRALGLAIDAFGAAGDPFEQARTRLLLGELLRRERQIAPARHELRLAAATFGGMGAPTWAARALGELRATRAAVPAPAHEPPSEDPLAALTPQERRVAEAAASGASDRQAAAELFLSPRTVAYHLSSVYRKLGVSSRAALAARLAQARSGYPPDAADR